MINYFVSLFDLFFQTYNLINNFTVNLNNIDPCWGKPHELQRRWIHAYGVKHWSWDSGPFIIFLYHFWSIWQKQDEGQMIYPEIKELRNV